MDVSGYAVVTGSARGIGRAVAHAFAKEGAAGVALLDVSLANLEPVKAEIEALKSPRASAVCKVLLYQIDVSNDTEVETVMQAVAKDFGRIDYVVNCAGIVMKHPGGAVHCKTDDWKRILDVNLNGNFYLLRAAARIMLTQERILSSIDGRPLQRGSIVNFASIQALAGFPESTAYNVSKAAVAGLTRTASEDYAKDGIRINAICPGYTETPMTTGDPLVLKVMQEKVAHAVPMQRMGKPEEIADGVLYLAGGRGSFVTGTMLVVDGGYLQR